MERADPIRIVEHDPAWARAFVEHRDDVQRALDGLLTRPVEHIGSTAVPGLAAKPIIDMLAVVADIGSVDAAAPALERAGWCAAPEPGEAEIRKRSYCRPDVARRTHHLHVVEEDSPDWPAWLRFRDRLRVDPPARDEYADLKRRLAAVDDTDRPRYRAGKAAFIGAHSRS